jgi:hypothetical protein
MNKYAKSFNPTRVKNAREHRPNRWLVKQTIHEEGGYSWELITGYDANLGNICPTTALNYALNNIHRFGGKLYADYNDVNGPILVEEF